MKINIVGLILLVFLVFGGYLIVRHNNYELKDSEDGISFAKDYSRWIWDTGKKSAKIVGAVVKEISNEEWLPENNSNITNESNSNKVKVIYE
jgi:hypothetical protein